MARADGDTKGVITKNFVDDMVNIMWARHHLYKISYSTCKKWCTISQGRLGLRLNPTKCEMIPPSRAARAAIQGCLSQGVRAVMSRIGTDLGGDQAGGSKRRRPKLLQRACNASGRAGTIINLIKAVKGMKIPGSTMQQTRRQDKVFCTHQYRSVAPLWQNHYRSR